MTKFELLIKRLQSLMNEKGGSHLTVDGDAGPITRAEFEKYEFDLDVSLNKNTAPILPPTTSHKDNPAYQKAKEYAGQGESNNKFVTWISTFWSKVGLKNYKTIIGSSFAWCALFIVAMQSEVGQKYIASAGAKDQGKTGIAIEWRTNGIPKGAIVHINHNADCKSESSNHVTFADGDCTPEDLAKPNAQWPGFGGNQADQVKRSMYPVAHICEVRWPTEVEKPGRITKSVGCSGVDQGKESTQ